MQAGLGLGLVDDPLFLEHQSPPGHPERPERLIAARSAIDHTRIGMTCLTLPPRDATDDELTRVHDESYLLELDQSAGKLGYLDADTFFSPESIRAAKRAAGGAVALVDALGSGRARYGLALLRPPGHHARPGTAMGFCLLNNVAIAAAHARARGAERVLVLDWDVHHGNGTQEMFYADPNVLFVSLHQSPLYPGTGAARETGERDGSGYTVNVPLSAGADDDVYLAAFDHIVLPIVEQYAPELTLISAGFDAHARDPLAEMQLSADGFGALLERLLGVLPERGAERLGLVLEGGYDLTGIEESLGAVLRVLDGQPARPEPHGNPVTSRRRQPAHEDDLERVRKALSAYWKLG